MIFVWNVPTGALIYKRSCYTLLNLLNSVTLAIKFNTVGNPMPFTLAHPAVVLFTPKKSPLKNYFHKPALIIGSMSPDFVYFLLGTPSSKIGHTLLGCLWFNLPLCFALYYLYQYLISPHFWRHLPKWLSLQPQFYPTPHAGLLSFVVFVLSCFIGMATHIGLDAFTHQSSTLVKHSDWLQTMVSIGGNDGSSLPVYKWFQYVGGILGLMVIGLYVLIMARRNPINSRVSVFDKLKYWTMVIAGAMVGLLIWHWQNPIDAKGYGFVVILVIRLVDVAFIALVAAGLLLKMSDLTN